MSAGLIRDSLTLEEGSVIHDFILLFSVKRAALYARPTQKVMRNLWRSVRRWQQHNTIVLS